MGLIVVLRIPENLWAAGAGPQGVNFQRPHAIEGQPYFNSLLMLFYTKKHIVIKHGQIYHSHNNSNINDINNDITLIQKAITIIILTLLLLIQMKSITIMMKSQK